ncbi:MotA/TolQ/ExbB proton channel family protein [Cerasicoccus maritimus]|uniref:MotA/TolQ/ExbB proton channel family protein n=1 Tax=Cerasicoccus maritimus TaxID=490089 RepID=UPI002852D8F4|nr:MotA/TolQ/ExbB proton channel family protein [Cerasicoccus maritimus]
MNWIQSFTLTLTLAGAMAAPLAAQNFQQVAESSNQKLEDALKELADVRNDIAEKKIPLSKSVSELESKVLELRRERNRLLKIKDAGTIDLSALERQVGQMKDQADFVNNRLNEFINEFEGRINISELAGYEEAIQAGKLAPKNENLSAEEKRTLQVGVIETALGRIQNLIGGHSYEGSALNPSGVLVDGKFAIMGPTVYFSSDDGATFGLIEAQLNAADPVVLDLPDDIDGGISQAVTSGNGMLPFDSTLGKALKVAKEKKSLKGYIDDGGEVGLVIIGLGILGFLLAIYKSIQILSFKVAMPRHIDGILESIDKGNEKEAQERAHAIGGIAGEMFEAGVVNAQEKRGILEEMLFERILKARPYLESFLPFLSITAAAAPLLGLLGTVIGMIKTFQLITIFGTGDAKSLSSGISEALVTTALGLIVAIPVLILHGMLSRMAKRKLGLLEQGAVAFVNGVMARRHDKKDS